MAGDYLYWQRRLHPEWWQSFLRPEGPPEALPPGEVSITRANEIVAARVLHYRSFAGQPEHFKRLWVGEDMLVDGWAEEGAAAGAWSEEAAAAGTWTEEPPR